MIVAAIITPPDVASQIIVAIPVIILYQVSIYISAVVVRNQKRKMKNDESSYSRHSGLRSILYYSLAASYFNRSLRNVTPNQSNYKNASAYNKSTGLKNDLRSSATSRRVSVPGRSSRGYGSGKSFRSFGG